MSSSSDTSPSKSDISPSYAQAVFGAFPANKPILPSDFRQESLNIEDSDQDLPPHSDTESKPRVYTRRLTPRKYIPADEIDENFNKEEWMKKLYGEHVRFEDPLEVEVPEGWVPIDGKLPLPVFIITHHDH